MSKTKRNKRQNRVVASAEKLFGEKVEHLAAPGGQNRSSYRLHLPGRTIVATLRPNFHRTHLEAYTLRRLAEYCEDTPHCLGVDGEIMFQEDVGHRRLNREIAEVPADKQLDLAAEAVTSIFRIQSAGRVAGLVETLPHLGQNRDWLENLVYAVDFLERFSAGRSLKVDKEAMCEAIDFPGMQFLKWDCRSGNAAIGEDERMRWFDFEYSGIRHGAEDLAWLIGDEAWPVAPDQMEAIVVDAHDPSSGHALDDYLDYLALYTTFHAVQRLKLIVKEAEKRGWQSKRRIRKYDDAGVHPEFAAHICRVGAHFAHRNAATVPIGRDFEEAEAEFLDVLRDGLQNAELETA